MGDFIFVCHRGALTSLSSPLSAAVVTAISLYMRHLGVRTKSGDKKSGRNFFRKKVLRSSLRCPQGSLETGHLESLSALCHLVMLASPFLLFPQVMGNRRSDEPTKTKKGFSSILDPARWNRGEPPGKRASLSLACPVGPRPPKLTVPLFGFSS